MVRTLLVLLLLCALSVAPAVRADPKSAGSGQPAATAPPELPLPQIPKLAPIEHPPAKPEAVQSLEARLDQLLGVKVKGPLAGEAELRFLTADVDPTIVPAVAQRLEPLRGELDGRKAEQLLERARSAGNRALRRLERAASKGKDKSAPAGEGDWLGFVLALDRRDDATGSGLVELYGMLRILERVGTTAAVREMIACYSYFGELVRVDLQRALGRLGHKAVAALIEAKEHDARKVQSWARRQLDALGRAIPGEAVSTTDPEVLADVLRAFGRVRDVDAAPVVLSFAGSDRIQLRAAAREALGAIGEPASWHLKESYESLTGQKAPRDWDFQRLARELFRLHDRARLTEVYELMDQGLTSAGRGDHAAATKAFDQVLARSPLFERRDEMAPAYLAQADRLAAAGEDAEALVALRKALRIAPGHPDKAKTESKLCYLEGKVLADRGTPDRFILRRALALDPDNAAARALLARLEGHSLERQQRITRYGAAAAVGVVALALLILLGWRRRPARAKPPAVPETSPDAPPPA
jgi:tetratricopeptide (TPR) repeat protein